jgi:hypothetical protein
MAPKGIKASKISKTRSKAKFIEWETREHSRGTRDIAVEVSASKGKRMPRQITGRVEDSQAILHEATLPSMDVDETFWTEEPVMDQQKRVSSPACPSLDGILQIPQSQRTYIEEFIPRMDPYLHCLRNYEGVPATTMCQSCTSAPFEWRCSDCFPVLVLCKECCRKSHWQLPFHRVQKWTGTYFIQSWLREVGVSLCLGHSGDLCPIQSVHRQPFSILNHSLKHAVSDGL